MGAKFTSRMSQFIAEQEVMLDRATFDCATNVDALAKVYVAKRTRALMKSGRIEHKGHASYAVTFNTPYARRREFENHLHPETVHYLKRAGDETVKRFDKYIKRV